VATPKNPDCVHIHHQTRRKSSRLNTCAHN